MQKIIIASTSTIYNGSYLEYLLPELKKLYEGVKTLIFIPFARPDGITHDEYTQIVKKTFNSIGIEVNGIHEFENQREAIEKAEAIFIGGGNTFLLVKQLYDNDLITTLIKVVKNGTPYLGTSAGSNICGLTMGTTNDMPIVYPPTFKTLGLVPFNINPHYLDPDSNSKHMGETRETRINEFHKFNPQPVIGLREGGWLEIFKNKITLKGNINARLFRQGKQPEEIKSGCDLTELK